MLVVGEPGLEEAMDVAVPRFERLDTLRRLRVEDPRTSSRNFSTWLQSDMKASRPSRATKM
jgi:hypothetical protein